jgi:uncharacterized membrane protein
LIFRGLQVVFCVDFCLFCQVFVFLFPPLAGFFPPFFVPAFSGIIFLIFNGLNVELRASGLAQVRGELHHTCKSALYPHLRQAACAYLKRFCFFF